MKQRAVGLGAVMAVCFGVFWHDLHRHLPHVEFEVRILASQGNVICYSGPLRRRLTALPFWPNRRLELWYYPEFKLGVHSCGVPPTERPGSPKQNG